jgi:hypothetical protein
MHFIGIEGSFASFGRLSKGEGAKNELQTTP